MTAPQRSELAESHQACAVTCDGFNVSHTLDAQVGRDSDHQRQLGHDEVRTFGFRPAASDVQQLRIGAPGHCV